MWDVLGPPLKAAGISAFVAGLALLLLRPPSLSGLEDVLAVLGGAALVVFVAAWATVAAIGKEMPEPEFQKLQERSDLLASMPPADRPPTAFDELVMQAIDDLPDEFLDLLERTPVVISHLGREHHAYGHYMGGTVARELFPERIVIYQDTLVRDFGHDPALLRAQVERTLRHEIAHHLGWGEAGVRGLGL
ncbi:MAG TPA: metallopeptidase family protein [Solirubrobacterales bacterium]